MMEIKNIMSEIGVSNKKEFFEPLLTRDFFRMERILSFGHPSAEGLWYDQEQSEWVLLFQGSAILEFENKNNVSLLPGDYLLIPAHCKHRVSEVSNNAVWIGLFTE